MIRINLLPVRAAKKKESVRFQLTLAGLITVFVVAVTIAFYFTVKSEATAVKSDIESGEEELRVLKEKIGELSLIKEQKRVVEEKLRVISGLEEARTGPSDLFGLISTTIPERAWLRNIKDDGFVITLEGFASMDEDVAEFMRRLQRAARFKAVELDVAQRVREPESSADVVSFIIKLEK
ncbi:MAG TPA: PilN domain-containing protein [Thermodesulfobacteriota bacterium]|nr:PilN domain-containing protein [Thermodesulfobacteriota bacterium]